MRVTPIQPEAFPCYDAIHFCDFFLVLIAYSLLTLSPLLDFYCLLFQPMCNVRYEVLNNQEKYSPSNVLNIRYSNILLIDNIWTRIELLCMVRDMRTLCHYSIVIQC